MIFYMINNPNDKDEIDKIRTLADKNSSLAIVSLTEKPNKLIENFSSYYLSKYKIITFNIGKNNYNFPENVSSYFLNFDFDKKMNILIDVHKIFTVNFLISKYFKKSKFYSYIEKYMNNNPILNLILFILIFNQM